MGYKNVIGLLQFPNGWLRTLVKLPTEQRMEIYLRSRKPRIDKYMKPIEMEHPGAVTFNDQYCIFKTDYTKDQICNILTIITHEMAHMWFGNLVTMDWWNDLWLNKSFADFISYYCLSNLDLTFEVADSLKLFYNIFFS